MGSAAPAGGVRARADALQPRRGLLDGRRGVERARPRLLGGRGGARLPGGPHAEWRVGDLALERPFNDSRQRVPALRRVRRLGQPALVRREHGLAAALARAKELKTFWRGDPSGGPFSAALANDAALADAFVNQDLANYIRILERSRDTLFNDTMPSGASGDQVMQMQAPACIMSGNDAAHAHSAAVALNELLPKSQLSPIMPPQQTGLAVGAWIRESIAWMQL